MSCIRIITPAERKRGLSDEAKRQRFTWPVPSIMGRRQQERMTRLSKSEKVTDRIVAAGNPSTPAPVLRVLSHDVDVKVRGWVARNPACPTPLLWDLTYDRDEGVAAFARFRLDNS